jgi:hypothetical protein
VVIKDTKVNAAVLTVQLQGSMIKKPLFILLLLLRSRDGIITATEQPNYIFCSQVLYKARYTRVEAGSNTSTVTLRVVSGDEMGLKKAAP